VCSGGSSVSIWRISTTVVAPLPPRQATANGAVVAPLLGAIVDTTSPLSPSSAS
jgi:hypothetical protein